MIDADTVHLNHATLSSLAAMVAGVSPIGGWFIVVPSGASEPEENDGVDNDVG
jgi:hypothetical protein